MGFMDKAKKLAEQAQQKLDEAQKNFNEGGATAGQPVGESEPTPDPAAPEPASEPASEQPTQALGANATPDPFKPLQK